MSSPERNDRHDRQARLIAMVAELRPQLHRYCSRLMGSTLDGEDVVQDTLVRALVALQDLPEPPPLRPWLFRVAHNRAIDLLRGRGVRDADPWDDVQQPPDTGYPDPMETLLRQETVRTAVTRFADLPIAQRGVVVLKDVLGESLADIAALLDLSVDAVKAHLARGRARLRELNARPDVVPELPPPSAEVSRYVELFNRRDWDALRTLLADDVKLNQSTHSLRVGRQEVGMFFTIYAQSPPVRLVPAWLEGQEVVAVFEGADTATPSYAMWLAWENGRIRFIRDYRYVRYVIDEAGLRLQPA